MSVTFTATVSGAGGVPTGTVTFYNGTTSMGTGTLANGVATLTTSFSSAGTVHHHGGLWRRCEFYRKHVGSL